MMCVCICVYMHHYDRHQSSRGTQGTGAPKRGTCPLLHLITTVIYYYDTLAAKDPKQLFFNTLEGATASNCSNVIRSKRGQVPLLEAPVPCVPLEL